jgi:hypothetical protein
MGNNQSGSLETDRPLKIYRSPRLGGKKTRTFDEMKNEPLEEEITVPELSQEFKDSYDSPQRDLATCTDDPKSNTTQLDLTCSGTSLGIEPAQEKFNHWQKEAMAKCKEDKKAVVYCFRCPDQSKNTCRTQFIGVVCQQEKLYFFLIDKIHDFQSEKILSVSLSATEPSRIDFHPQVDFGKITEKFPGHSSVEIDAKRSEYWNPPSQWVQIYPEPEFKPTITLVGKLRLAEQIQENIVKLFRKGYEYSCVVLDDEKIFPKKL